MELWAACAFNTLELATWHESQGPRVKEGQTR